FVAKTTKATKCHATKRSILNWQLETPQQLATIKVLSNLRTRL
ncbi:hypothetical protein ACLKA6_012345, partial [Drosophila palustris]